jgi:hypothetical protein
LTRRTHSTGVTIPPISNKNETIFSALKNNLVGNN